MNKFWICWVEGSSVNEFRRHESFDVAQEESKRLAMQPQNDGKRVFVFECIGSSMVKSVTWEFAKTDEVPF
jgi:hypothetical protein